MSARQRHWLNREEGHSERKRQVLLYTCCEMSLISLSASSLLPAVLSLVWVVQKLLTQPPPLFISLRLIFPEHSSSHKSSVMVFCLQGDISATEGQRKAFPARSEVCSCSSDFTSCTFLHSALMQQLVKSKSTAVPMLGASLWV